MTHLEFEQMDYSVPAKGNILYSIGSLSLLSLLSLSLTGYQDGG